MFLAINVLKAIKNVHEKRKNIQLIGLITLVLGKIGLVHSLEC